MGVPTAIAILLPAFYFIAVLSLGFTKMITKIFPTELKPVLSDVNQNGIVANGRLAKKIE